LKFDCGFDFEDGFDFGSAGVVRNMRIGFEVGIVEIGTDFGFDTDFLVIGVDIVFEIDIGFEVGAVDIVDIDFGFDTDLFQVIEVDIVLVFGIEVDIVLDFGSYLVEMIEMDFEIEVVVVVGIVGLGV